VAGSFIMGLDVDRPGIGLQIARTADRYGVDILNASFLTPLPGTDLWKTMEREGRIAADHFPEDWRYYTLTMPVGRYRHLGRDAILDEMDACNRYFYSPLRILRRVVRNLRKMQRPVLTLVSNLASRNNCRLGRTVQAEFRRTSDRLRPARPLPRTGVNRHVLRGGTR
jgi:radical SAM superfamily enzyme YgiQ (UPF0313 family)